MVFFLLLHRKTLLPDLLVDLILRLLPPKPTFELRYFFGDFCPCDSADRRKNPLCH